MKIVIAVYRDSERAGGSIRVAEVLARSLPAMGMDLHIVVAYGGGGRLKNLMGEKCSLMGASGPHDLFAWARYRALIKSISPDIIHYVDNVGWMILAGSRAGPKRVNHQHFRPDVGPKGHKRFRQIKWLLGTADRVISISFGARRVLVEKCGIAPSKIAVVHNAVDASYLHAAEDEGRSGQYCVLGMAVRVVEDKGIEDAFNLLRLLPERFQLAIAGDGPARHRLESLGREMGLGDRIAWKGSVEDVSEFYFGIDFYLFMSWYEGFGLAVAEAMHCGVPVVGLLGDGEIGEPEYPLVTKHNSVLLQRSKPGAFEIETNPEVLNRLASQLQTLETDAGRRGELTSCARSWVADRFSSKIFAGKLISVYDELLSAVCSDQLSV